MAGVGGQDADQAELGDRGEGPSSCLSALPGTIWRPLAEPASCYPWSVLWHATETSGHVRAVVSCAQAMSKRLGWLATAGQAAR
jgi:hypothetical protein